MIHTRHNIPNLLLIAGTGRNSGKTLLAEKLIKKFSSSEHLVAMKIAPHMHPVSEDEKIMYKSDSLIIISEQNPSRSKDSSRMLAAGADKVYYVQVTDDNLEENIPKIIALLGTKWPVICESGGLRNYVRPGLFFIMTSKENTEIKHSVKNLIPVADMVIQSENGKIDFDPERIRYINDSWEIAEDYS